MIAESCEVKTDLETLKPTICVTWMMITRCFARAEATAMKIFISPENGIMVETIMS